MAARDFALACLVSALLLLLLPLASSSSPVVVEVPEITAWDDEILAFSGRLIENPSNWVTVHVHDQRDNGCNLKNAELKRVLLQPENRDFLKRRNFAATRALFNEYDKVSSADSRKVEEDFISAMLSTPAMEEAYVVISSKGLHVLREDFKDFFTKLWITKGADGYSGFQRVFTGKVVRMKGRDFLQHYSMTWFRYFTLQEDGRLNYVGSVSPAYKFNVKITNAHFLYQPQRQVKKAVVCYVPLLIGAAPEVEIALYTVCHVLRRGRYCKLVSAGYDNWEVVVSGHEENITETHTYFSRRGFGLVQFDADGFEDYQKHF